VGEETARIADPRDRVDALAAPCRERLALARVAHAVRHFALEPHPESLQAPGSQVRGLMRDHRVNAAQTPRRLAQRPGGQQPSVAEAARIHDRDLDVAAQRVVLQAVVEHHHVDIGMLLAQPLDDLSTIGSSPTSSACDATVAARGSPAAPP
jgi:hypothetical protein